MSLSTEQQSNLEYQTAVDQVRNQHQLLMQAKTAKLEALRMARDIAMENHRTATAGTVLAATDILAIAAELETFTAS